MEKQEITDNKENLDEKELIDLALEQFDFAMEQEQDNRTESIEDIEFVEGKQWSDDDLTKRAGRPCLKINKLAGFVDIVEGDYRMNRPSIKVIPFDDKSDPETAKMLTGLIKNIENNSASKIAYDTGFGSAATCGYGNIRVVTEYAGDDVFEQNIGIEQVENQFSVIYDPNSKKYDRSDGNFVFVFEDIPEKTFKEMYPDARVIDFESSENIVKKHWRKTDTIRVAEWFRKVKTRKMLHVIDYQDGPVVKFENEITEEERPLISRSRMVDTYKILHYKMTGVEILEGPNEWPGKYFPLIPIWGKTANINGERRYRGLVRFGKDPQRAYNYWRSATTEIVAGAPKNPWLVTPKQIGGHEESWQSANTENLPYLLFNPDEKVPGYPKRETPAGIPTGAANEIAMADQEMRDTTRTNEAKLGMRSNERSGVAVQRRALAADTANYTFIDNMARSIEQVGRVIIDLIPKIYDTERIVRIMNEDGSQKSVPINASFATGETDQVGNVIKKVFDLTTGKYDVVVTVGPGYRTQREEAAEKIYNIMQTSPDMSQAIGDLMFKYSDFHGADEIAERLRKAVPPQLLDESGVQGVPPEKIQMIVQEEVAKIMQQVEAQTAQAKMEQEKIKVEQEKAKLQGIVLENQRKQADIGKKRVEAYGKVEEIMNKTRESGGKNEQQKGKVAQKANG